MSGRNKKEELTELDLRVRKAKARLKTAEAKTPHVDSLVARLRRHLEENHFGERLYSQMLDSRRE